MFSVKSSHGFSRLVCFSSNPTVLWVDSPRLQADVSFLSDPNNDYFLQVTAVVGQNESQSVPEDGVTFSYFKDSMVNQKCKL